MSTRSVFHAPVELQDKAKLFTSPVEVRQAIYDHLVTDQVHVFLRQGKFHLSPCVESCPFGDHDGFERRNKGADLYRDPVIARRLRSSWGPHWRCEEVASGIEDYSRFAHGVDVVALLLVCKRMYIDAIDLLVSKATFNITDLDTLNCLLSTPTPESGFLAFALPHIRKLDISLRLPLPVCESLERGVANSASAKRDDSTVTAWRRIWPAIARLKELRKLRIWLDHDEPSSWSVVNERAVLSYLNPLIGNPDLSVSINLPKLHPQLETADRHFGEDGPMPKLKIDRRLRQRYHAIEDGTGSLYVSHEPDFPLMIDVPQLDHVPRAELEEQERCFWKKGIDVYREFLLRDGFMVHTGVI